MKTDKVNKEPPIDDISRLVKVQLEAERAYQVRMKTIGYTVDKLGILRPPKDK